MIIKRKTFSAKPGVGGALSVAFAPMTVADNIKTGKEIRNSPIEHEKAMKESRDANKQLVDQLNAIADDKV